MKLIVRLILIVALTWFLSFYLPWWIVIVVSFLVGLVIDGSGFNAFISGFLGAGLLWLIYSWYLDIQTNSILSSKLVELFPFDDKILLIIMSGLIGGLCGGFGAVTGNSFRKMFVKTKPKSFYS